MGIFRILSILLLFGLAPLHSFAQQKEPIGRVLITRGNVEAIDTSGSTRSLRRRSEFYQGESIITESNGFAQIRMIDGAQISITTDSTYTFIEYMYHNNPAIPDIAILELSSGGFRSITGSISDSPDDTYELRTDLASIHVRGSTYECKIDSSTDPTLYCGVSNGGITVSNNQGAVDLGLGAAHDYVRVPQNMTPEPLMQQPPQLANSQFSQGNTQNQSTTTSSTLNPNAVPVIRNRPGASSLPPAPGATPSNGPGFPVPVPITVKPYKAGSNP